MTDDFFRSRLDGMIDPRHPLAVLGDKLPWFHESLNRVALRV